MKTLQFEALKVALKQDKTGYVLTLCMHPDDIPIELLRDFVGARYQVVMVRLGEHDTPIDSQEMYGGKAVQLAGILCKEKLFWKYLHEDCRIIEESETEATDWLREYLGVKSRTELKSNHEARERLFLANKEYMTWKEKT